MIGMWKTILCARAAEWGLPSDGNWNFLLHNNYHPTSSTFNVLWFHEKDRFPRAVTKIGRQEATLAREFESLQTVYKLAGAHVPRPLHVENTDGFWMLWMTGVPGLRIPRRSSYPAPMLISMVNMLASIHHSLARPSGESKPDRHERMVTKPLEALAAWGPSADVRAGCMAVAEAASTAWVQSLPVIPQHGDLFLDNVLRHGQQWYVVDWETFAAVDLPFYDLLTLLRSALRASGDTLQHLNRGLVRQVPILVEQYALRLGLPVSLVQNLLPLTIANWFYLHWLEGRRPIMEAMYTDIENYFKNKGAWDEVFVKA
jgi:aminoglycoside phosphotransferase (APT) family kinase protein